MSLQYDWKNLIQPLTDTEEAHIVKLLSDPVCVKYFKNLAYSTMIDQALTPVSTLVEMKGDVDFRIMAAYHKGKLEVAEAILSHLQTVVKPPKE